MKIQSKTLAVNTLTLAVAMGMATMAQANGSNTEVEQLRGEVKELRALLEQYVAAKPAVSMPAPGTPAQNYPAPAAAPKANGLSFTTPSGTEVKFYGNIRADVAYQAEGGADGRMYNQINKVPLNDVAGVTEASDRLKTTLNSSRFGFDFKTATQAGDVAGKLEMDFVGGAAADQFRIRHAYMTYGNWLVGQTWSNFAITDYMPETIDALGYVGGSVKRTPQVRYTQTFSPNTNFAVALEDSKDSDATNAMRLPALTARLNQKFANGAGIITPRVMVAEKKTSTDETTAWGAGLGVKYNVTPSTTLKADYYHVKGDSSFVAWSNPGYIANATTTEILAENEFDSITVGITQQFNPKWRGTLGYGYMKADDDKAYTGAVGAANTVTSQNSINDNLWQGWANVFYSPVKPLSFGLEYVYGERETFTGKTGEDNRVQATAIYNF